MEMSSGRQENEGRRRIVVWVAADDSEVMEAPPKDDGILE